MRRLTCLALWALCLGSCSNPVEPQALKGGAPADILLTSSAVPVPVILFSVIPFNYDLPRQSMEKPREVDPGDILQQPRHHLDDGPSDVGPALPAR